MRIRHVAPQSTAARAGLAAGDELLAINEEPVEDLLDFLFAVSEAELLLDVQPAGSAPSARRRLHLTRHADEELGIELDPDPIRRCSNRCTFCFIDQNPRGLRPSLYVKDEDYRHSLLYGNYITLTNLSAADEERICAQQLSPLYVSVHATDPAVRQKLLRCGGDGAILPILERLAAHGIELHAQIVVVPEQNDGPVLAQTLADLERLGPQLASVAVVPVGLTRHRDGLAPLRPLTGTEAAAVLDTVAERQARNLARAGRRLHFAADEFYFLAGRELPPFAAYEAFAQIENGVGMVRHFEAAYADAPRLIPDAARETIVATGRRFAPWLRRWLTRRLAATGEEIDRVRVVAVPNRFYGEMVTTAGLLVGADIAAAVAAAARRGAAPELVLLPPDALNGEGRMLDDMTPHQLAQQLACDVAVGFAADPAADLAG